MGGPSGPTLSAPITATGAESVGPEGPPTWVIACPFTPSSRITRP
ncbi:DUF6053 domain-containing protein [Lysobacter yananisis]